MTSRSAKRRADNRQREQHADSRASAEEAAWARWVHRDAPRSSPSSNAADHEIVTATFELVEQAVLASMRRDESTLLVTVEALVTCRLGDGSRPGLATVESALVEAVRQRFSEGWQPLDLAHVVKKLMDADHRVILAAALQRERYTSAARFVDDRWRRQLLLLDVADESPGGRPQPLFDVPAVESLVAKMRLITDVRCAVELLVHLRRLPRMPTLLSPPSELPLMTPSEGTATSALDEKVLGKVRALLAKAESTTFAEEADALTSKAQELMARHAIDLAMVASAGTGEPLKSGASARRVHVEDPYFDAKSVLLTMVARANRCTTVSVPPLGMVTVFGFAPDLDIVELLFTSLLTQCTTAMVAVGSAVDRSGTSRTKSFRRAFILAFAVRIGERLTEATRSATEDATSTMGASVLPVLASRDVQVRARQNEIFPHVRTAKASSFSNAAGWQAGRAAADRAALHAHTPIANRPDR
jgi:hypothetical protein